MDQTQYINFANKKTESFVWLPNPYTDRIQKEGMIKWNILFIRKYSNTMEH